jgi:hypothetical protein
MPLVVVPLVAVWWILAHTLAWLTTFMVWPSVGVVVVSYQSEAYRLGTSQSLLTRHKSES